MKCNNLIFSLSLSLSLSIYPIRQPPALSELMGLYVGRCHSLWKEAGVMLWMEGNVKEVLRRVDVKDPVVEECQNK